MYPNSVDYVYGDKSLTFAFGYGSLQINAAVSFYEMSFFDKSLDRNI